MEPSRPGYRARLGMAETLHAMVVDHADSLHAGNYSLTHEIGHILIRSGLSECPLGGECSHRARAEKRTFAAVLRKVARKELPNFRRARLAWPSTSPA